ncbi:hypothetical protein N2152v2_001533 [Parachlorella kessleri]
MPRLCISCLPGVRVIRLARDEQELQEAVALYHENILAVQGSLESDPHNPELLELVQELQEALAGAKQALAGLQAASPPVLEAYGGSAAQLTAVQPQDSDVPKVGSALAAAVEGAAEAAATEAAAHLAPWPDGSILDPWPKPSTSQSAIGPQLPSEGSLQQEPAPDIARLAAAEADKPSLSAGADLGNAVHATGRGMVPQAGPAASSGAVVGGVLRPAAAAVAAALRPQIHPRNKYATELPDFGALATVYPRLQPYLQRRGPSGRPSLDFTNPRACRELTRALLWQDFGVDWWLPEGQLVPPVTNRANYIHWLQDLLELAPAPGMTEVVGLDIGCGANLIYPLLGASIAGWRFVAVDVTDEALAWAAANSAHNPRLAPLIEVRRVGMQAAQRSMLSRLQQARDGGDGGKGDGGRGGWVGEWGRGRTAKRARREQQQQQHEEQEQPQEHRQQQRQQDGVEEEEEEQQSVQGGGTSVALSDGHAVAVPGTSSAAVAAAPAAAGSLSAGEGSRRLGITTDVTTGNGTEGSAANGPAASRLAVASSHVQQPPPVQDAAGRGIVSGAVRQGERFVFCMCNPPFFEMLEEAGRNPATAFSGTAVEMVYPGGELAFVEGMVEDSFALQGQIHWYTTMVGKKVTLKAVRALLYRRGVRVLRTTEFVQGKTSRWAIAWSFTADPNIAQKPLPRPTPAAHPAV